MFDTLSGKLSEVFDKLRRRGALSEADVTEALREIRLALLDADVALSVVKDFIAEIREKAVGAEVLRSVSPGQMVVKIVNDALIAALGGTAEPINLLAPSPIPILMVGLQGSGKTTTSGKIALRLKTRERKKVLLASLDTQRPAAQLQLEQLAQRADVTSLPIIPGQSPLQIAHRAMDTARRELFDVVILDTAGRLSIDLALMEEVKSIRLAVNPVETLLVVDAMTGQDAVTTAKSFNDALGITGIVITRLDGDARGGAALSMRAITGAPIKLVGTGEKLDALYNFDPERVAGRILGMGDIVGLVEKAAAAIDEDEARAMEEKMRTASFDLNDFLAQFKMLRKLGPLENILGMLPGMGNLKDFSVDEKQMKRVEAIVLSMTLAERTNPDILNARRRQRIARGSGVSVTEVNDLLQRFGQMRKMMKKMGKMKQMLSRPGAAARFGIKS